MAAQTILQSLNKAYRRVSVSNDSVSSFRNELSNYFTQRAIPGNEDAVRQDIIDFLKNSFYNANNNRISPFGTMDIAIHLGATAATDVGVIIEVKKPSNTEEMITRDNLNKKALHELLLYYLRERVGKNNTRLRKLIVTNSEEFFIFEPQQFEDLFLRNRDLVSHFNEFNAGQSTLTRTSQFYDNYAAPAIDRVKDQLDYAWFDINKYKRHCAPEADLTKLVDLYKVFSPENLLKKPFQTDSNKLDTKFYNELLYIIGLEEVKAARTGNKKIIRRMEAGHRNPASLIEDTIATIDAEGSLNRVDNLISYGKDREEQLYNVSLSLVITWINRILFLKLLESQMRSYNADDDSYTFMTLSNLPNYSALNQLFFQVLAIPTQDRNEAMKAKFAKVPYLNSSLFEVTNLENATIRISSLSNGDIPVFSRSVLNSTGRQRVDRLPALQYLLDFLSCFDFTGEGMGAITTGAKTLINASVLGLIFEKINGHKDGAIFTPGRITMRICRTSLCQVVVKKFNEAFGWSCKNYEELLEMDLPLSEIERANRIMDSILVCDPAVGSGHFLVSILNEFIRIKYELGILCDTQGRRIKKTEYDISIENDELIISESDGHPFRYTPTNPESQRIQQAIFEQKRIIIENCLFGVDLNENAVAICRLRLWIELLKNAYYTAASGFTELETLPNIDINIKVGNSLLHRFQFDADIRQVLSSQGVSIQDYKAKVAEYKNTHSKTVKTQLVAIIEKTKKKFHQCISFKDKQYLDLVKDQKELITLEESTLFGRELNGFEIIRRDQLRAIVRQKEQKWAERREFAAKKKAFEWRVEFPELLNENGDFMGFDLIVSNPPYGALIEDDLKERMKTVFEDVHKRTIDIYNFFISQGIRLLKPDGIMSYIVPNTLLSQNDFKKSRLFLLKKNTIEEIINMGENVFKDADVPTCIFRVKKQKSEDYEFVYANYKDLDNDSIVWDANTEVFRASSIDVVPGHIIGLSKRCIYLLSKVQEHSVKIDDIAEEMAAGISTGCNDAFIVSDEQVQSFQIEDDILHPVLRGEDIDQYSITWENMYIIYSTRETAENAYPNALRFIELQKDKLLERTETERGLIPWWVINRPRKRQMFESEKIIMRQTSDRIRAVYDNSGFYNINSILDLTLKDDCGFSSLFVLGVLNSSLSQELYRGLSQEEGRSFAEVKPINVRKLYIPNADDVFKHSIEVIVKGILDGTVDKENGMQQIDDLLYDYYDIER